VSDGAGLRGGRDREDPTSEARRFDALLSLVAANVPEFEVWRLDRHYGDEFDSKVLTLSEAWVSAMSHLFDEDDQPLLVDTVWPRILQVVEVAILVSDILWSDEAREADFAIVDGFASAGFVCDLTESRASIRTLLPWMGPETVAAAQGEVEQHSRSRGFGVEDIDWSGAGSSFIGLSVRPLDLVPTPRP